MPGGGKRPEIGGHNTYSPFNLPCDADQGVLNRDRAHEFPGDENGELVLCPPFKFARMGGNHVERRKDPPVARAAQGYRLQERLHQGHQAPAGPGGVVPGLPGRRPPGPARRARGQGVHAALLPPALDLGGAEGGQERRRRDADGLGQDPLLQPAGPRRHPEGPVGPGPLPLPDQGPVAGPAGRARRHQRRGCPRRSGSSPTTATRPRTPARPSGPAATSS